MMNYDVILIRYGELSLKSDYVRKSFESVLVKNITKALRADDIPHAIRTERGRIYLSTPQIPPSITILSRIFGIVSCSPAVQTDSSIDDISSNALQLTKNIVTKEISFAIRPTRVGNHHFTSQEVAVRIGTDIVNATHAKVNLTSPDVELFIEIRDKKTFLFTEKIRGVGGLPLGTQGKILCLVEDPCSLLAAWYLMRRGCHVIIVNMKESNERSIHSFLMYWFADADIIFLDPTTESFYQQLYTIATEKKCDALITSHTLENPTRSLQEIARLKKETMIPVLSPLIAMTQKHIQEQCRIRGIII
jgi:thiamine biosynthesis protein ThiI